MSSFKHEICLSFYFYTPDSCPHSECSCISVAFTLCMNKQLEALEEVQALPAFEQILFSSAPEPEMIIILPCKHSQAQVTTWLFQDELL